MLLTLDQVCLRCTLQRQIKQTTDTKTLLLPTSVSKNSKRPCFYLMQVIHRSECKSDFLFDITRPLNERVGWKLGKILERFFHFKVSECFQIALFGSTNICRQNVQKCFICIQSIPQDIEGIHYPESLEISLFPLS